MNDLERQKDTMYDLKKIKTFFDKELRGKIRVDGGDADVESLDGNTVNILAGGDCSNCPVLQNGCLSEWLSGELGKKFPGLKIHISRKVHYFRR